MYIDDYHRASLRMLHIEYILPIMAFWHTITTEIRKHKQDQGVVNNLVSAIHCAGYIVQYTINHDHNYTIHVSIGYFIYDLMYLLYALYAKKTTQQKQYIIYVVHHFIGLYILHTALTDDKNVDKFLYFYYLAELSNITMYLSYHIRKEYPTRYDMLRASEFAQLLWYSYFRVIRSSIVLYYDEFGLFQYPIAYQYSVYLLYVMGILCSWSLLKKNIANYLALSGHKTAAAAAAD